ncbi:hypothetical protein HaLaN_03377 [Haematococcus lacustris]|uniref:Uncharacterized protein n=1 Tax=Haematococcus lacustris TaxID=44745 RepID=A0A699YG39_HAELA|nr:hypothetical protein HaLaN_03377 [Haematococcus lacustris]
MLQGGKAVMRWQSKSQGQAPATSPHTPRPPARQQGCTRKASSQDGPLPRNSAPPQLPPGCRLAADTLSCAQKCTFNSIHDGTGTELGHRAGPVTESACCRLSAPCAIKQRAHHSAPCRRVARPDDGGHPSALPHHTHHAGFLGRLHGVWRRCKGEGTDSAALQVSGHAAGVRDDKPVGGVRASGVVALALLLQGPARQALTQWLRRRTALPSLAVVRSGGREEVGLGGEGWEAGRAGLGGAGWEAGRGEGLVRSVPFSAEDPDRAGVLLGGERGRQTGGQGQGWAGHPAV